MRGAARVTVAVLWLGSAAAAGAQQDDAPVPCRGQRVDAITVVSRAPSVAGVRGVPVLAKIAQTVHVTTQPDVVERFLLLRVGDRCSPRRVAESERVLRGQPFLADASIVVLGDDSGGVVLEVHTIDEVAAVFSATVKAKAPLLTGVRLGDANWGGEGIYAAVGWWHENDFRDEYSARVTDYQFLGRPYQATVLAARNSLGGEYHFDVQRPFLTDLQRVAWRAQEGEADDYVRFVDAGGVVHTNRLARTYTDVGGLVRVGPPGRLALLGVSVSHEAQRPGLMPVFIGDAGAVDDPGSALAGRYPSRSVSRINALVGYRNLKYVRVTGLDGLNNVQDVPGGFQFGALVGKSAPMLGSEAHDMLVGGDVYAGHATTNSAVRIQAIGEARRSLDSNQWDGLLGSGRAAVSQRMGKAQILMSSLEWSGGWRVQVPFRVTLAGSDGGVRGLAEGTEQGGRRAVARLEDRWMLGSPRNGTADLGLAVFADAGWLWAGDVPYGTTTPARYSAGVSLLVAVPSRSARMWRVDFALPNVPGRGLRLAVGISLSDATRVFWQEPRDIARARERSVPAALFNWP